MNQPDSAPEDVRFCPRCGMPLETRQVTDKLRRVCPACDYIHFTDPKVGVGVLVLDSGRVLLVRRAVHPQIGRWSIPAGFLDRGEDPQVTAAREAEEETGLQVAIRGLVDVYFNPPSPMGGASVFILYRADLLGGELQPGDDVDAADFFALNELPELAFESTRDAISRVQAELS